MTLNFPVPGNYSFGHNESTGQPCPCETAVPRFALRPQPLVGQGENIFYPSFGV